MAKQVDATYGNALFELAMEEHKLDELYDEAQVLVNIFKEKIGFEMKIYKNKK